MDVKENKVRECCSRRAQNQWGLLIPGVPRLWVSTSRGGIYPEVMKFSELASGCVQAPSQGGGQGGRRRASRRQAEPSCQTLPAQQRPPIFLLGQKAHVLPVRPTVEGALPGCAGRRASALPPGGCGGLLTWSDPSPPRMVTASGFHRVPTFSLPLSLVIYPTVSPAGTRPGVPRYSPGQPSRSPEEGRPKSGAGRSRRQPHGAAGRARGEHPRGWDPLLPPAGRWALDAAGRTCGRARQLETGARHPRS